MTININYFKSLKYWQFILLGLFALYFSGIIIYLFQNIESYSWDFKVNYSAAVSYRTNLNPYNISDLYSKIQNIAPLPYMYPPIVIYYYLPFTLFGIKTATYIFLSLKLAFLVGMFFTWSRLFDLKKYLPFFLFYTLLAFNGALLQDLFNGNVVVFESFFLWLAIYFFVRDRLILFISFVILASTVKILPIVFLGFILYSPDKNKYKYLIGSLFAYGGYIVLNFGLEPVYSRSYMLNFTSNAIKEGGIANACTLEFIKSAFYCFSKDKLSVIPFITYLVIIFFISIITYNKLLPLVRLKTEESRHLVVFTLALTVLLVLPRFKDYSYTIVLLPVFYIIVKNKGRDMFYLLIGLTFLSCNIISIPLFEDVIDILFMPFLKDVLGLIFGYYTLIIAFISWLLCLSEANKYKSQLI